MFPRFRGLSCRLMGHAQMKSAAYHRKYLKKESSQQKKAKYVISVLLKSRARMTRARATDFWKRPPPTRRKAGERASNEHRTVTDNSAVISFAHLPNVIYREREGETLSQECVEWSEWVCNQDLRSFASRPLERS